jgi:hypothetical protein
VTVSSTAADARPRYSDACAEAESTRSNIGCKYWVVPMANDETFAGRYDFRIVVANPNEVAVNVRIFRGTSMVASQSVDANGVRDIVLPWIEGVSDAYDFASLSCVCHCCPSMTTLGATRGAPIGS